mmetsp:Transcript_52419/g.162732  ORF Transcript_52419/g.162732 Transcript_52419/m.162732 type:complete len:118 (-) Transcript_52419:22-375(-)
MPPRRRRGRRAARGAGAGAAQVELSFLETASALLAGFAAMLQQLPRATCDAFLSLLGAYLGGLCAEAAEAKDGGKELWAEGVRLLEFLGELLELLGLPREHLGLFAPLGMLDLWVAE